ncbi:MAG: lysoplasmalogenase [Leptospira sp.]|nr:lysoplasmalogenase [Leptospira sp.]
MMKSITIGLGYIYPILAMVYIASMNYVPYAGHPYVKALPIIFLAGLLFWNYFRNGLNTRAHFLFGAGLILSSIGDISLATIIPNAFVIGLGFFLLAHVVYILGFSQLPKVRFVSRKGLISGILVFGGIMAFLILPITGDFLIPVAIYLIVITTMGCFAILQRLSFLPFALGAFIFMVSDSIIALNKFWESVPYASLWIMTTYYIAQGLLARGILSVSPAGIKHS